MSVQTLQLRQEDEQKVEQEASNLIRKIATTDTLALDTLMDEIGNLGSKTQEKAGQTLQMLDRACQRPHVRQAQRSVEHDPQTPRRMRSPARQQERRHVRETAPQEPVQKLRLQIPVRQNEHQSRS